MHHIPTTQFDLSELRMFESIPVHISLALQDFIIPLEQFEIIFNRMFTIPLNVFEVFDTRLFHRAPKFNCPRIDTAMLVRPLIERASNYLFGMILEIAIRGNVWVSRNLGTLRADLLKGPQIIGILFFIRPDAEAA